MHSPLAIAGLVVVSLACLYALIRGGPRERIGALAYGLSYALSYVLAQVMPHLLARETMALRYMGADVACLLVFIGLSWKAPHAWPLWAAGLQLLSVMAQVITLSTYHLRLAAWTFMTLEILCGYGVLLALVFGTMAEIRRRQAERRASQK